MLRATSKAVGTSSQNRISESTGSGKRSIPSFAPEETPIAPSQAFAKLEVREWSETSDQQKHEAAMPDARSSLSH